MNGIQLNSKPRRNDKPVPGCLGRMVNLFDLTSSISGNRLLTDKPHNDGSSLSRSRSDVSRMSSVAGEEMQDEVMISELRRSSSSKKPNGTPVKMLIAQEMSKDLEESRHSSPNVVARLMGLEALPQQQPDLASRRSHSQCYTRNGHTEKPIGYWQEEHGFFNQGQSGYMDIYETWQQSQRTNCIRDKSPQKGRCNENVNEKKLALIRQKFVEAKRLATDEKLRQTKEFQDALDVLSSNGDLFLKVLQEPTSLFPQHLETKRIQQQQHIQWSPTKVGYGETKRITVLKPSKMLVDDKFVAPAKRNEKLTNLWDNHNGFSPTMSTCPTQPTRIVVLKPSMVKANDVKAVVSSTPSSPRTLPGESSFEEPEDEEAREAREVAKEITKKMRENLAGHRRRDEALLSSVFSNGYTGDESSFDKSDNEFAAGNLSDSEVMSPTSRRSWDYVNRYGSPFSSSSFSHASCSPESSVCREAKKRLSERWAMMSSNGSNLEQRHVRRSSSTLGEMLALSDTKKPEICEEDDNSITHAKENGDDSPRGLLRSKSVPVSSTAYGDMEEGSSKEMVKTKASKSSFTGKVTSLFFSRSKKSRNEKSGKPQSDDLSQLGSGETLGTTTSNDNCEVVSSSTSRLRSETVMGNLNDKRLGERICPQQGGIYASSQQAAPGIQGENQDQPSPVSVLEPPFEKDESATLASSRIIEPNTYAGKQLPFCLSESNLIDKSPPIGSIARTLSWDERGAETTANYPLSFPFVSPIAEDDEGEWLFLVKSLLSMTGLDDEGQLSTNFARWHSPGTPLDPVLRDKYIDAITKEPMHEAKRRQLRSTRKLVFDCVNAALLEITGTGTTPFQWAGPHILGRGSMGLAGVVWARMKEWFSGEVKEVLIDGDDISSSLVEIVVRNEVVGKGWAEQMKIEIDNLGKEIEGKLLEELVEESVVELNGF